MSQITTIIFDIGNVLVEQRFEALAKSLSSGEEEYGILMVPCGRLSILERLAMMKKKLR